MAESNHGKLWTLLIAALIVIIAISGYFVWRGLSGHRPLEIELSPPPSFEGQIYIGGNVTSPGYYPFKSDDSVSELVRAAGGTAVPGNGLWRLDVAGTSSNKTPQLVNINRAETWLLKTLPGIGDMRAQAIVDYRTKNGKFHNVDELTNLPGIGPETLENLRKFITVAD